MLKNMKTLCSPRHFGNYKAWMKTHPSMLQLLKISLNVLVRPSGFIFLQALFFNSLSSTLPLYYWPLF